MAKKILIAAAVSIGTAAGCAQQVLDTMEDATPTLDYTVAPAPTQTRTAMPRSGSVFPTETPARAHGVSVIVLSETMHSTIPADDARQTDPAMSKAPGATMIAEASTTRRTSRAEASTTRRTSRAEASTTRRAEPSTTRRATATGSGRPTHSTTAQARDEPRAQAKDSPRVLARVRCDTPYTPPKGYRGPRIALDEGRIERYKVRSGDTWWGLARRHAIDYAVLRVLNAEPESAKAPEQMLRTNTSVWIAARTGAERLREPALCATTGTAAQAPERWMIYPERALYRTHGDGQRQAPPLLRQSVVARLRAPSKQSWLDHARALGIEIRALMEMNGVEYTLGRAKAPVRGSVVFSRPR